MNPDSIFRRIVPGATRVPVVLDSPHSGSDYPEDFRHRVDIVDLRRAEDSYVDELYASGPRYGATLIAARFPRSYIDPNRSILDMDASLLEGAWPGPVIAGRKSQLGIGLIWRILDTGEPIYDRKLSVDEIKRRITHFHQPYQKAVKDALDTAYGHFGAVWHLNCHSMPALSSAISEEGPGKSRPDFVLGDRDGTTCDPEFTGLVHRLLSDMGYEVKVNDPYKGVELVRAFSDPSQSRHSLQIEVNRRLYMDEQTRRKTPGFSRLARDLERVVKAVCEYAAERVAHGCHDGNGHHRPHHHGSNHGHAHDHHEHPHDHHHEHRDGQQPTDSHRTRNTDP